MEYETNRYSIISEKARIGSGTKIWHFCNVMEDVEIGENCNIGQGCYIESGVKIGNGVTIKNNISLYSGVECEDNVFLGPNCVFTNVINPRAFISRKQEFKKTLIKKGATIGANATIVCGNTIGQYAMVGAGSVVIHDVPEHCIVVGNPAKVIGYVCECGEKISSTNNIKDQTLICHRCGNIYYLSNNGIKKDVPTGDGTA